MKFPSFDEVALSTKNTILRFPIASIVTIIGTILCLYVNYLEPAESEAYPWIKSIGTCLMGLPLFFATHIYIEKNKITGSKKLYLILGSILILAAAFFTFQWSSKFESKISLFRYLIWLITAHLLVSISAFQRKSEINGFWQFNKLLFLRFTSSFFFSFVLFLGLSGAILSINALFEVDIDEKIYLYLFIFLAGIFNTFYFMAGMPTDINELDKQTNYPSGLRIFSQFILIPLVIIYLIILYLYGIKIIFQGHLPIGWVSNLILTFSVFGILALLLVYPLRNDEKHVWIKTYSKVYFIAILPLIALLFVSIIKRINDYGFTEWRYIGIVLGIWLLLLSFYFIFFKSRNIFYIPFSLLVIGLLGTIGYWNMFKISKYSQAKRFKAILAKNDIIKNNLIDCNAPKKQLDNTEIQSLESILEYMDDNKNIPVLYSYFDKSCIPLDSTSDALKELIPIDWQYAEAKYENNSIEFVSQSLAFEPIDIVGFKTYYNLYSLYESNDRKISKESVFFNLIDNKISMYKNGELQFGYDISNYATKLAIKYAGQSNYEISPDEKMVINITNTLNKSYRLTIFRLHVLKEKEKYKIDVLEGIVLEK